MRWIRKLTVAVSFLFSVHAGAQDCSILEPWLTEGHTPLSASLTNAQRVQLSQREYRLRVESAHRLETTYRSGQLRKSQLAECLAALDDRENFLDTFYYTLFEQSVARLDASKSPAVQAMMRIFHAKYGDGIPLFRVLGSFQESDPSPLPGGYHRASGSMYMNFAEIDPSDWQIIFVHETLHALDAQINEGVATWGNEILAKYFAELSRSLDSPAILSPPDFKSLGEWLMAGLDRGLLAEYRAWSATFQIYQQGVSEGLWSRRPWLEELLKQKQPSEAMNSFTFRLLDQRSADPTDGIFSRPLISRALKQLRQDLRQAPNSPSLAGLDVILHQAPL